MTIRARIALATLGVAALAAGCEPVPYVINVREANLLPPDMAVDYLRSLPPPSGAVIIRPDHEHCEFASNGMRVAAANPQYAQRVIDTLNVDKRRVDQEQATLERERQRAEDEQRDRVRWMRSRGFTELADEQRRLQEEHRTPERWLRLRGLPAGQIDRAYAGMDREKADLANRMKVIDGAMARERQMFAERREALDVRERQITNRIAEIQARVHEVASYERVAFVVVRRFRGEMTIDIEYEVPNAHRIDGCGFRVEPNNPQAPETVQRIATALTALGAEGQTGVRAEPPLGEGRRWSASSEGSGPSTAGRP